MSLATVSDVNAALATAQRIDILKTVPNVAAGNITSAWKNATIPAAGSNPGSLAGVIPTNATTGALPFDNRSLTNYLMQARLYHPTESLKVIVYDRLWHNSEMSGTATTDTTLGSVPALTRPDSAGADTELWIEIYSNLGITAATLSVSYTNQSGTTGQIATWVKTTNTAQVIAPMTLAAGDSGVASCQSYSWSVSTGSAGNFGLTIVRRIAEFSVIAGQPVNYDWAACSLSKVYDSACLALAFRTNSAGLNNLQGYFLLGSA